MKTFKVVALLCSFALIAMIFAANSRADTFDKKTVITFSESFEVPGVDAQILPAGTYVFKVLESFGDRNIVQIFNADETHLFTTILAINNYRLKPTEKTVLTFKERGEGQPEAIKAWFYPGYAFGQEFVYSKKRAMELANKLGARYALILGDDEIAAGRYSLKNMQSGEQHQVSREELFNTF